MSLDWDTVSPTEGLDPVKDSPFTFVEVRRLNSTSEFNGLRTYQVTLKGNAQQYSFEDQVVIAKP